MAGVRVNARGLASLKPSFKSFKRESRETVQVLASKNDSERSLPNPGNLESRKKHRLSVDFRS